MMFLQFASKKDHAQTFAQITPSEKNLRSHTIFSLLSEKNFTFEVKNFLAVTHKIFN